MSNSRTGLRLLPAASMNGQPPPPQSPPAATKVPTVAQHHKRTIPAPNEALPHHPADFIFLDPSLPNLSHPATSPPPGAPETLLTVAGCLPRGGLHESPRVSYNFRARSTNGSARDGFCKRRGRLVVPRQPPRTLVTGASRGSVCWQNTSPWPLPW